MSADPVGNDKFSIEIERVREREEKKHLRIFRGLVVGCVGGGGGDDDETAATIVTRITMNKMKNFVVDIVILTRFMLCDNQIQTELEMFSTTL